ncbi:MAG TPA: penicillin acylase family protein [Flavisolibacter sp.]|nr:penicillin acylase family protein [Flavisolibacter sp.]
MRIIPFIISTVVTLALVFALDNKWGPVPPLGRFLSPQQGFWQNAEAEDAHHGGSLKFEGLKGKVDVYFDDRLVPHVFAENEADLYFVQGYLHAKYRLWQMELQTYAAAGRISEKMGNDPKFVKFDKGQRRAGMVYAAERALKEFEADPASKASCDAYTAGVNAYINSLTISTLPLEYKLLDYKPEPWTNLKIALFLKQMSQTLSGFDTDLQATASKPSFSFEELMELDPQVPDSLVPIVPKGTAFEQPGAMPVPPASADSAYFGKKDTTKVEEFEKPNPLNGSNNWVVGGKKTQSGLPILCNDPHLTLSFPSIWYEMQLSAPGVNVYGATFPGSPNVIIGFNDQIAWGVTNAQRDVRDYYEISFRDESRQEYFYNGQWMKTEFRTEAIKVRGEGTVYDTVAYTVFGPVMYDDRYPARLQEGKAIALRWTAHDPSNEGLTFYKLNRAGDYNGYLEAIKDFSCPGQNFVFASKGGDIAIWQQGKFPARWYGQGVYLMPGADSSYAWQGFIPQQENPHAINPDTGFLQSANQRPVDSSYPYFIPGNYINARGVSISRQLSAMQGITPADMMALQNNNYSVFAEGARAMLLKYVRQQDLDRDALRYLNMVRNWDLNASPESLGITVYQAWFDSLEKQVWADEWDRASLAIGMPDEQTLLEWINRDSAFRFIDNRNTEAAETIQDLVTEALKRASPALKADEAAGKLAWAPHRDPSIYHLLGEATMPFARKVNVGGWSNVINATTDTHGPSWRMIVHLTTPTEAYGVYPGGQSGNPGSRFYDNFVDTWAQGKYNTLWMMKDSEARDKRIIGHLSFNKA